MEITVFLGAALLLMIVGVVGSFAPLVPSGLLSIAGILVYWWSTGYTSPGPLFLLAFVAVGGFVVLVDWAAGAVAARVGGASTMHSLIGAVVGFLLFFVLGPLGIVLGVAGTVFVLEFYRGEKREQSAKAALYAVVGALGSSIVQFVLTLSLLIAFLVALAI